MTLPSSVATTDILDFFRSPMLSHLLVIGTTTFNIPQLLADYPLSFTEIQHQFNLRDRPLNVLLTAWRSMGLLDITPANKISLSPLAQEKLSPHSSYDLSGYIALGAYSIEVKQLEQCLIYDKPVGEISFVYHAGDQTSALDNPEISDPLTRAMAGRARNVAPFLAQELDLSQSTHLLDVGGAHAIYSLELLKIFPQLKATILDRAAPLKVAQEYLTQAQLLSRAELIFADIHTHILAQPADVVLMANILHDYNDTDAANLVSHYAKQLPHGGRIIILDAFLAPISPGQPPVSTGPAPVAAYSAFLFTICEGRCYRLDEYQNMLTNAGLSLDPLVQHIPAHGSLLTAYKNDIS
jgi:hypothetical protein